jgi:hypothetical protein
MSEYNIFSKEGQNHVRGGIRLSPLKAILNVMTTKRPIVFMNLAIKQKYRPL